MWKQHKLIYGEHCDDFCPCPSDAQRISQAVVKDYLLQQNKKGNSKQIDPNLRIGENPVGFLNRFVGKFYNKVKNEFPSDFPRQILNKLVGMWSLHKTERRFGLHCKVTCSCAEAWKSIFLDKYLHVTESNKREKSAQKDSSFQIEHNVSQQRLNQSNRPIHEKEGKSKEKKNAINFQVIFNPHQPLGFYCATRMENVPSHQYVLQSRIVG